MIQKGILLFGLLFVCFFQTEVLQASPVTPANGDLEQFADGFPLDWSYGGTNATTPSIENTTITSPFADIYSLSTASVALSGADGPDYDLYDSFSPQSGNVTLSFDFMYGSGSGTTGDFGILLFGPSVPEGNLGEGNVYISGSGSDPSFNLGGGGPAIVANTWYQFSMAFTPGSYFYQYTLTAFGGQAVSNIGPLYNPFTDIEGIGVDNFDSSDSGASNPTLYLDNFSIVPTPTPEPSIWICALIGLGLLAGLARCGAVTLRN